MQGPGSIRIEVTERQLPNGKVVEFVYKKLVYVDDTGMSHVQEKLKIPETRCGCSPSGIHDIRSCAVCNGEFCLMHTLTAECCGRVICRSCSRKINGRNGKTNYCKRCFSDIGAFSYVAMYQRILRAGLHGR